MLADMAQSVRLMQPHSYGPRAVSSSILCARAHGWVSTVPMNPSSERSRQVVRIDVSRQNTGHAEMPEATGLCILVAHINTPLTFCHQIVGRKQAQQRDVWRRCRADCVGDNQPMSDHVQLDGHVLVPSQCGLLQEEAGEPDCDNGRQRQPQRTVIQHGCVLYAQRQALGEAKLTLRRRRARWRRQNLVRTEEQSGRTCATMLLLGTYHYWQHRCSAIMRSQQPRLCAHYCANKGEIMDYYRVPVRSRV